MIKYLRSFKEMKKYKTLNHLIIFIFIAGNVLGETSDFFYFFIPES